jgi:hypothetical protein|uniref:Uncharacterized protein n=1 Tax=Siphoviridae sp. ctx254 TaxID=2825737 RepID=A0A8S5TVL0_9CAUD|nr:MAG TPA: hypothetical protein [Siphoviridae sp. ctx254]
MAYEECPGYMKNGRCKGNNRPCRVTKEDIESWFDETLKPIDLLDVCPEQSAFGNNFFVLTDKDIEALKTGKVLFVREEYGVFLKYKGEQNDVQPIEENNQENRPDAGEQM